MLPQTGGFALAGRVCGSTLPKSDAQHVRKALHHLDLGRKPRRRGRVVIDGCPPRLPLGAADIQPDLDRRRPGQSDIVSPRKEQDLVRSSPGCSRAGRPGPHLHAGQEFRRQAWRLRRDPGEVQASHADSPTRRNTASGTIAAAAEARPGRRSAGSPLGLWRRRSWPWPARSRSGPT